jgi:hypothetical protein
MIMKLKKYIYGVALGALSLSLASCYNADKDFPDYEGGTTAYFAFQNPVRTLILGNDIYDNSLDNAHKCRIWATMGGAYGGRDAFADIVVDESLCDNLYFTDEGGNKADHVTPMPADYYTLSSNVIPYNGDSRGYVEVQFTDKFFNDPDAIKNKYVIPLRMTHVTGIDHILTGTPREGLNPARQNTADWDVLAKDYVLYCVKYMNPWQAKYIRRGVDKLKENEVETENVRKDFSLFNSDVEHNKENPVNQNDEVCSVTTMNMTQAKFPVYVTLGKNADDETRPSQACNLILTFNDNKCTISAEDAPDVEFNGGSGEFIVKGTSLPEYKDYQWGNMNGEPVQRDILRLSYGMTFKKGKVIGTKIVNGKEVDWILENDVQVTTNDTLVVQDRESNKKEFFKNTYVVQP